VVKECKEVPLN